MRRIHLGVTIGHGPPLSPSRAALLALSFA